MADGLSEGVAGAGEAVRSGVSMISEAGIPGARHPTASRHATREPASERCRPRRGREPEAGLAARLAEATLDIVLGALILGAGEDFLAGGDFDKLAIQDKRGVV